MRGRYVMLVSPHGLIRSSDLELGRDSDTGGQTQYVVELARALARNPDVERVDLVTRLVRDEAVDAGYAEPEEELGPGATLVRLPCGPEGYLRKEVLWPYLDELVDRIVEHVRDLGRVPDLVHAHYADAGYVASEVVSLLGVSMVYTGHSLGRVKLERLLAQGMEREEIEELYHIGLRIEAEETALDHADLVVTSTHQEIDEQYDLYDNHDPASMVVIPPGVDLQRFHPPRPDDPPSPIADVIDRFLYQPRKPVILAISRPDPRKNLRGLLDAFGQTPELREMANLVLIAGARDDIAEMEEGPRGELTEILLSIDRWDLYGHVAYPKQHSSEDVPDLYRLAAARGGVFVNPALTEPFGLTLIEAAASGLPIVATNDGGPRDIVAACRNGVLIEPLDTEALGRTLVDVLSDRERLAEWSESGERNARRRYDWDVHVADYLQAVEGCLADRVPPALPGDGAESPLAGRERLLLSDVDGTLLGDDEGLVELVELLREQDLAFGVATGRSLESALRILEEHGVPRPDVVVSAVGSRIHYGPDMVEDERWSAHLDHRWSPDEARAVLLEEFGDVLELQPASEQLPHKISFDVRADRTPDVGEVRARLRSEGLHARLVFSHDRHLDLLPIRCSKGHALRWIELTSGLASDRILVAGDSGNDAEMLKGRIPAVVVGNHAPELERLRGRKAVYFAEAPSARGILEGIRAFGFLGELRRIAPDESDPETATREMAARG